MTDPIISYTCSKVNINSYHLWEPQHISVDLSLKASLKYFSHKCSMEKTWNIKNNSNDINVQSLFWKSIPINLWNGGTVILNSLYLWKIVRHWTQAACSRSQNKIISDIQTESSSSKPSPEICLLISIP